MSLFGGLMGAIPVAARNIKEKGPLGGGVFGMLSDAGGSGGMGLMSVLNGSGGLNLNASRAQPQYQTKPQNVGNIATDEDMEWLHGIIKKNPKGLIQLLRSNPDLLKFLEDDTPAVQ